MELSINLSYLKIRPGTTERRSFADALAAATNAGFKYFDYCTPYREDNYLDLAKRERELILAAGAAVEQSHAPYNRYNTYPDVETFTKFFHRSFETAAELGAKYMVVHADEYRVSDHYDVNEIIEFTYNYLAPELEFAKKHGMKLAIENVFEDNCGKSFEGKSRFTSRIEELVGIIERFNDPDVVCCWDFGHASASFGYDKMLDNLKQVGKYLRCTHVHDNFDMHDRHQIPFTGKIDWAAHMKYMSEIGYGKDNDCKLSFEFVYYPQPDDVFPAWLAYAKAVGDSLVKLHEQN